MKKVIPVAIFGLSLASLMPTESHAGLSDKIYKSQAATAGLPDTDASTSLMKRRNDNPAIYDEYKRVEGATKASLPAAQKSNLPEIFLRKKDAGKAEAQITSEINAGNFS